MTRNNLSKLRGSVVFIMGATATGKTDLAVELVRRLPFHIVSVDSAMVYRGLDIGTAKPGPDIQALAPHRLIDIREPADTYSAADFREDALREIAEVHAAGAVPLLVGGTMLYFKALRDGLAEMPGADEEIRRELDEEAAKSGWAAMHRRLAQIDPLSADRIHPNDPQRIQRALEVYYLTGTPLSERHKSQSAKPFPYQIKQLIIDAEPRSLLHQRIEQRFDRMLESGFVEEVAQLMARPELDLDKPAMRAVGYRQVWKYLDGNYSYEMMRTRGIIATRQLAKRQLTWLRGIKNATRFDCLEPKLLDKVLKWLESGPKLEKMTVSEGGNQ